MRFSSEQVIVTVRNLRRGLMAHFDASFHLKKQHYLRMDKKDFPIF